MEKENKSENYYLLEEIILGLREVYLNNEKQLERLREYLTYDEEKIDSINFRLLNKRFGEGVSLVLYAKNRRTRLQKAMDKITNCIGISITKNNGGVLSKINRKCDIENSEHNHIASINDYQNFALQANNILTSAFAQGITMPVINLNVDGSTYLKIKTCGICLVKNNGQKIFYNPKKDSIEVSRNKAKVSKDDLEELLHEKIPMEKLDVYHKNYLADNISSALDVCIVDDDLKKEKTLTYQIIERPSVMILKKKL